MVLLQSTASHRGAKPVKGETGTLGLDLVANGNSGPPWGWRGQCRATARRGVLFEFSIHITNWIPCSSSILSCTPSSHFGLLFGDSSVLCHQWHMRLVTFQWTGQKKCFKIYAFNINTFSSCASKSIVESLCHFRNKASLCCCLNIKCLLREKQTLVSTFFIVPLCSKINKNLYTFTYKSSKYLYCFLP